MSEKRVEAGFPIWKWEPIKRYTREEALERAKDYFRDTLEDENADSPYPDGEYERILASLNAVNSLTGLLEWEGFKPGFLEEVTEAQRMQAITRALGIAIAWDDSDIGR